MKKVMDKKEKKKLPKAAKIILTIVIIAVVIFGVIGAVSVNAAKNKAPEVSYDKVKKTDVKQTLSATGSIISNETTYENGQGVISQYPVKSVDVSLGDEVHAGDTLFTLDMSALESDISTQEQLLAAQKKADANTVAGAQDSLNSAQTTSSLTNSDAARSVTSATEDLQKAQADEAKAEADLADLQKKESDAKTAMDNLYGPYNSAKSDMASKQTYYKAQSDAAAKGSGAQADANYQSVAAEYNTAVSDYNAAKAAREAGETALDTAKQALTQAQRALDTANSTSQQTAVQNSSTVSTQQNALNGAKLSSESSTIQTNAQIANDKKNLEKGIVTAEKDGTVTAVNVKPGMIYAGDSAVVIDDMTGFKASLNVDEADISKITVGQKAEIKTDATEDDVLKGTVTFVSPVSTAMAQQGASTSSDTAAATTSRASYRVDITLDHKDDRLRLGMTAKINIIIAESDDTLAVPDEDIVTDKDGNSFVTAVIDGRETKVPVETGVKNDYLTEVKSDKLKEKMKIVQVFDSSDSADEINNETDAVDAMY